MPLLPWNEKTLESLKSVLTQQKLGQFKAEIGGLVHSLFLKAQQQDTAHLALLLDLLVETKKESGFDQLKMLNGTWVPKGYQLIVKQLKNSADAWPSIHDFIVAFPNAFKPFKTQFDAILFELITSPHRVWVFSCLVASANVDYQKNVSPLDVQQLLVKAVNSITYLLNEFIVLTTDQGIKQSITDRFLLDLEAEPSKKLDLILTRLKQVIDFFPVFLGYPRALTANLEPILQWLESVYLADLVKKKTIDQQTMDNAYFEFIRQADLIFGLLLEHRGSLLRPWYQHLIPMLLNGLDRPRPLKSSCYQVVQLLYRHHQLDGFSDAIQKHVFKDALSMEHALDYRLANNSGDVETVPRDCAHLDWLVGLEAIQGR